MLSITGLYPTKNKYLAFVARINLIFTIGMSMMFLFAMSAEAVMNIKKFKHLMETLSFCLSQLAFICKMFIFVYQRPKLIEMERILASKHFNSQTIEQDRFIRASMGSYFLFVRMFRYTCIVVVIVYAVFPLVDNHMLAVPAYFIFDEEIYRYYLYLIEQCCFMMNAYNNPCFDCIPSALISMASAQFHILKENLSNIGKNIDTIDENKRDVIVDRRLRECIIHHNAILDFVSKIENMFSPNWFCQILACVLVFCITLIRFLFVPAFTATFLSLILYFVTISFQIGICCWFGQDILTNSSDVGQAGYMSNWYECSPKNLKTLFIIMERSKRPAFLTAGKFFTLSLVTFLMILKSAYSYFAVIRRMYQ